MENKRLRLGSHCVLGGVGVKLLLFARIKYLPFETLICPFQALPEVRMHYLQLKNKSFQGTNDVFIANYLKKMNLNDGMIMGPYFILSRLNRYRKLNY